MKPTAVTVCRGKLELEKTVELNRPQREEGKGCPWTSAQMTITSAAFLEWYTCSCAVSLHYSIQNISWCVWQSVCPRCRSINHVCPTVSVCVCFVVVVVVVLLLHSRSQKTFAENLAENKIFKTWFCHQSFNAIRNELKTYWSSM